MRNIGKIIYWGAVAIIVVGLFLPIGVSFFVMDHDVDGQVVGVTPYTGDHGVSYRVFTLQTPRGLVHVTVTCTYFDNAATIPLVDRSVWLWGYTFTNYLVNPPVGVAGC